MQQDFLERLRKIGMVWESSPEKAIRAEQELKSEFLASEEGAVEQVAQVLADPSSSPQSLELALEMVTLSMSPKFIPYLIQLIELAKDEDLCEYAADILGDYGEAASRQIIEALNEDFKQRKYSPLLVEALGGGGTMEFVEGTLKDFLSDPERYEDWFDLPHFAWKLADSKDKERSLRLVSELLKNKGLGREEKVWLRWLERRLIDEKKYEEEIAREEKEERDQLITLTIIGILHSPISAFAPDGPMPVIDDNTRKEYSPILYEIEEYIFEYYRDHPSLKDGEVMKHLKNLRDGLWKVDEWRDDFEGGLVIRLKMALFSMRRLRFTKGEVSACISHVLNSLKRHREEGYERAYLDFLKDFFEGRLVEKTPEPEQK
jgi:hypothetical protein